ncbi:hypothetical protein Hdeb2414_s0001g00035041 [Helianthus debilis subsp. tardiflorus]
MKILKGRAFSDLEYNFQAVLKVVPDQYDEFNYSVYASDASAVYGLSALGLLLISQMVEKCGGFLLCFLLDGRIDYNEFVAMVHNGTVTLTKKQLKDDFSVGLREPVPVS